MSTRHLAFLASFWLFSFTAKAHDIRPILLQLEQHRATQIEALIKVPIFRDAGISAARPVFPEHCQILASLPARESGETLSQTIKLHCAEGLDGAMISITGFSRLAPDALVLVRYADGRERSHVLDANHSSVVLKRPADSASFQTGLLAYILIGIEHIVFGFDHLLFLLGLVLVIWRAQSGLRVLILTITAFTVSHSLTLTLAILGGVSLPSGPVEALIALSVLLLAVELARSLKAPNLLCSSLTFRKPWLLAFAFGLLHGFGFAGVLGEIGLPEQTKALALLLFNLGVELGQIIFITLLFAGIRLLKLFIEQPVQRLSPALNFALGSIAAAWLLERLPAALFAPLH